MGDTSQQEWWVSCQKFTCWVETNNGIVLDTAPILRSFIGQPIENILTWIRNRRWGPHKIRRLKQGTQP